MPYDFSIDLDTDGRVKITFRAVINGFWERKIYDIDHTERFLLNHMDIYTEYVLNLQDEFHTHVTRMRAASAF